ncbi:Uncharacterised protein [Mycobacterium tuberculosis]|nr:Uncharacterised protein [Mycobacterium tuberculosis]
MPGSHHGSAAASCSQTKSQSATFSQLIRVRGPITPERWLITMARVMSSLPACPNSGQ